jgi:GTPase SAR1 family protein
MQFFQTVGADFIVKQVPIAGTNILVELYIYDCAGQSIFNQMGMNAKYFEGASAVMVVYDVSSVDSLKACPKWLDGKININLSIVCLFKLQKGRLLAPSLI